MHLHSGETFCRSRREQDVHRRSWQFLVIFAIQMILTILAIPVIFAALMIRSFERNIVNGKKIHADRRQGDRREDFERALKTPKGS